MDFLAEYARYPQDVRWGLASLHIFLFSCGVSLCKIQGGTTRKAILERNSAVFLCCAKSVSDDDYSVLLFFYRC